MKRLACLQPEERQTLMIAADLMSALVADSA